MSERLFLDFEVYSEIDLTSRGSVIYARHDSTMPVCMSHGFDKGPIELWTPSKPLPDIVKEAVRDGIKIYAHNATFDYRIWNWICTREFGWPRWALYQTVDTQALCQTYSLPGKLAKAGPALRITMPKHKNGLEIIKKTCMPQKDGRQPVPWDPRDKGNFQLLFDYCIRDSEAMREIVLKLPRQELLPVEHKIWEMTYDMNTIGLPVDPVEINAIVGAIDVHTEKESGRLFTLSGGAFSTPGQFEKIKGWCAKQDYPIDNLQADYLEEILEEDDLMPAKVREMLELRQLVNKTSTAKFRKFQALMNPREEEGDSFWVNDNLVFHGAGPGRWTAKGVQMQNFPRIKFKTSNEVEYAIEAFVKGEPLQDPVAVAKKLIRGMIKAPKGYQLIVDDFNSIENRDLAWIAQDSYTLNLFRNGLDQYIDMASDRYGETYEAIREGHKAHIQKFSDMRQMGKVIILGCGYGMGWETFIKTAKKQFKMIISEEDAKIAVAAYRLKYYLVVELWKNLKNAAARAVITGQKQKVGLITFGTATVNGIRWLAMQLPSGKSVYYMNPGMEERHIPKFEHMGKVPTITHEGINSYSKKWSRLALIPGRITENAVQGTAREQMAHGMFNVVNKMPEVRLIGTVHDEAIGLIREEDIYDDTLSKFGMYLCDIPWAKDCPLTAEGFIAKRYRKD